MEGSELVPARQDKRIVVARNGSLRSPPSVALRILHFQPTLSSDYSRFNPTSVTFTEPLLNEILLK